MNTMADAEIALYEVENEILREDKAKLMTECTALEEKYSEIEIKIASLKSKYQEKEQHYKEVLQQNLLLTETNKKNKDQLKESSKNQRKLEATLNESQQKCDEEKSQLRRELDSKTTTLLESQQDLVASLKKLDSLKDDLLNLKDDLLNLKDDLLISNNELCDLRIQLHDLKQLAANQQKIIDAHGHTVHSEAPFIREAIVSFEEKMGIGLHSDDDDDVTRRMKWESLFKKPELTKILTDVNFHGIVQNVIVDVFKKLNSHVHSAYMEGRKVYIRDIFFSQDEIALLKAIWTIGLKAGTLVFASVQNEVVLA